MGLLENDSHWEKTLTKVRVCIDPKIKRDLFGIVLVFCQLSDLLCVWNKYKTYLWEDIYHSLQMPLSCDINAEVMVRPITNA